MNGADLGIFAGGVHIEGETPLLQQRTDLGFIPGVSNDLLIDLEALEVFGVHTGDLGVQDQAVQLTVQGRKHRQELGEPIPGHIHALVHIHMVFHIAGHKDTGREAKIDVPGAFGTGLEQRGGLCGQVQERGCAVPGDLGGLGGRGPELEGGVDIAVFALVHRIPVQHIEGVFGGGCLGGDAARDQQSQSQQKSKNFFHLVTSQ